MLYSAIVVRWVDSALPDAPIASAVSAEAQSASFVIMGSNSGISDWDANAAGRIALRVSRKLSTTNHGWMMPYTMLGFMRNQ